MENRLDKMKERTAQKRSEQLKSQRHTESLKQGQKLERTVVEAVSVLIKYLDSKTTKTEVVNQLKEINTPDVLRLIPVIEKLDKDVIASRVDLKPLLDGLKTLEKSVQDIPKGIPKAEKQQFVDYTKKLGALEEGLKSLEKAIENKDLSVEVKAPDVKVPDVTVPAPIVNVETNLKPIQDLFKKLLPAIEANRPLPHTPTDLTKVEEKLDTANKHLETISKRPQNTGGSNSPYVDENNKLVNVPLEPDLSIPVTSVPKTQRYDIQGDTIYEAFAVIGTADNSTGWSITKYDLSDLTDASGLVATDVSWDNRTSGSYA